MKRINLLLLTVFPFLFLSCVSPDYGYEEEPAFTAPVHSSEAALIYALKIEPDGRYLASSGVISSREHIVFIWDLFSGKLIHRLEGHFKNIYTIDIASKSGMLLSSGQDNKILQWDYKNGEFIKEFPPVNTQIITSLVFDPDEFYFFTGGSSGILYQYSLLYEEFNWRYQTVHDDRITILAMDPYGRYLASGGNDGKIVLWQHRGGPEYRRKILEMKIDNDLTSLCFSKNGKILLAGDNKGMVHAFDVGSGEELWFTELHNGSVWWITVHPDGERFFTGGNDFKINVCSLQDAELLYTIDDGQAVQALAVHPRGKILVSGGFNNKINLYDADSYQLTATLYAFTDGYLVTSADGFFCGEGEYMSYINPEEYPAEMDNPQHIVGTLRRALMSRPK